jgi:glycosyltransferase involved in cell wall biosynthesis
VTRVAAVLWSGAVGGAETFTVDLCRALRTLGADVGVVFVCGGAPLSARLDEAGIPHRSLGLRRGRDVVRNPRRLARAVRELGPDGALLQRGGYLAATLRAGGYRGRVVAVAHDALLDLGTRTAVERLVSAVDRGSGFWASDVEVAVSDFAYERLGRHLHARRLVRIYNGVDLDAYRPASRAGGETGPPTIGFAGRLVDGKGVDVLLRAFARGASQTGGRLRIAGDGPQRSELEALARSLSLNGSVEFVGWVPDVASFWGGCDIAAMPSDRLVESFGLSAVEAMACGRPVVAARNGALAEIVDDGATGRLVPPGDVDALAAALEALGASDVRRAAGVAARAACEARFDLRDCARSYLDLFGDGAA